MNTCRILLAAVFILTITIDSFAVANRQSVSIEHENTNSERLLRGAATDVEPEADDRDFISTVKLLLADFKTSRRTSRWAKSGTTDEQVREKLGLVGLTGKALEDSPNYKIYQQFLYKAEGVMLDKLLYKWTQTETVWKNLKLEDMEEAEREASDALRVYKRYALKVDNIVPTSSYLARWVSYAQNTEAEMAVKIQLWVEKRRSKFFVKHMLGLEGMDAAGRKVMATNKYYEDFLIAVEKAKQSGTY